MTRGLLGIIKLVFFLILLPALIAVIIGFQKEATALAGGGSSFWWGVVAYVIFHLFVYTPQALYRFWQGVFMEICSFTGVAANAIVIAVPIIPTVFLLVYFLLKMFFGQNWNYEFIIFIIGFALALHIILSAQELYETDESQLKGHYLLHAGAMVIVNILLIVLLMDLVFVKFSFLSFWKVSYLSGSKMYAQLLGSVGIRW